VTKCGDEVAFAAGKVNGMIRCLGFWVKVILSKIVEPEVKCCLVVIEIVDWTLRRKIISLARDTESSTVLLDLQKAQEYSTVNRSSFPRNEEHVTVHGVHPGMPRRKVYPPVGTEVSRKLMKTRWEHLVTLGVDRHEYE